MVSCRRYASSAASPALRIRLCCTNTSGNPRLSHPDPGQAEPDRPSFCFPALGPFRHFWPSGRCLVTARGRRGRYRISSASGAAVRRGRKGRVTVEARGVVIRHAGYAVHSVHSVHSVHLVHSVHSVPAEQRYLRAGFYWRSPPPEPERAPANRFLPDSSKTT